MCLTIMCFLCVSLSVSSSLCVFVSFPSFYSLFRARRMRFTIVLCHRICPPHFSRSHLTPIRLPCKIAWKVLQSHFPSQGLLTRCNCIRLCAASREWNRQSEKERKKERGTKVISFTVCRSTMKTTKVPL